MNYYFVLKNVFVWVGILAFLTKLQRLTACKYRRYNLQHFHLRSYVFLLNHFNNFFPLCMYRLPLLGELMTAPFMSYLFPFFFSVVSAMPFTAVGAKAKP